MFSGGKGRHFTYQFQVDNDTLHCKWTFTKRFTLSHYKTCPILRQQ